MSQYLKKLEFHKNKILKGNYLKTEFIILTYSFLIFSKFLNIDDKSLNQRKYGALFS